MKQPLMLVTGASRGIGAEIAKMAGRSGYKVGVNFHRSEKEAREVVAEIKDNGSDAVALQADAGDSAQVAKMFERFDAELGALDVLVNNAGMLSKFNVTETDIAQLAQVFSANVFSAFYCSREAVRRMSTKHGGRGGVIVNMSSVAARTGGLSGGADVRSDQGCDGFIHGRAREGSRRRRHPCQCNSAGIDRHRNSQRTRRSGADGAARESRRAARPIGFAA